MRVRSILPVFCFSFFSFFYAGAQRFGGTPSSVKWKQINTDTVRVVFPAGLDSLAQRIALVTHDLQKNYSNTIGNKIRKVSIVLQKDATLSNAYVGLGPYRSEFYLMPPQDAFELGAQNWADNLAIHEFRHVQQYSNFNVGLSKALRVVFGENGQALANAASVPDWFFEGDAVYNETMLSTQGRGRLPQFFNAYKSLYYENRHYSYMQLRNGSFKNFIPGHYELGYMLVSYGREKYGVDFWKNVTHNAAAFKPLFYPLQGSVKKAAGISYNQFVDNAFIFYNSQWNKDDTKQPAEWITATEKNNVVNYRYPYKTADGSVIALKTTNKDIPALCMIHPDGREDKIAVRDIAYDDYFSYNNGKVVYAAYQPDVRWGNRDYSVLKVVDVVSGEEKKISSHTKYFSPDISHDGKSIAAVEMKQGLQSDIVVLNEEGVVVKKITGNSNTIYSYPKFSEDDRFLYVITRNDKGEMGIEKRNLINDSITSVLPVENRIIGFPVVKGDTLLYSCSNNGRDEIWAFINAQNKNYRLASYQTGLYQASLTADGKLVSSTFTSNGYRLAKLNAQWQEVNSNDTLTNLFVTKPFNAKDNAVLSSLQQKEYTVTKYPKLIRPFNFHSWNPYLSNPDYSFNIYGENVLNTLQSQIYYSYNANEKYNRLGYTAVYGGWYVQPVLDINQTYKRNGRLNSDTTLYWNEFNAAAGLRLPLNLSGGKQLRNLSLTATYDINNVQWTGFAKQFLKNLNFNYVQTRLTYTGQIQKATQQIYPRWGQAFVLQYRDIIEKYTAHQLLASGTLYLPGIAKTHSLVVNAAYQARDTAGDYTFTNNFPFSRGYDAVDRPRVWKLGVNYHFPLLYPDWGFANLVYFRRIRANAYYDYSSTKSLKTGIISQYRSYGAEIYFDTKWWNQQSLIFGIRYSRLIDYELAGLKPNQWQIILPVTILN